MANRLKVLVLSQEPPYPPTHGGLRIRLYHLLKHLNPLHDLTLLTLLEQPEDREFLEPLEKYCRKVLAFDGRPPTRRPTLRERLQAPAYRLAYRQDMADAICRELRSGRYDLVHVTGGRMAVYTPLLRGSRKIIAATDSSTLAYGSRIGLASGFKETLRARYVHALSQRYERVTYRSYDACVVIAERDAEIIRHLCPNLPVHVIPNGVTSDFLTVCAAADATDGRLIFTGTMDFMPNIDAVIWFTEQILPRIKARFPEAHLQIAGRNPTEEILNLARRGSGVTVTGFVPDLRPHLAAASVYVCPLRCGAGMKNKLLEAMAAGMAVVTTTEGASGNAGIHDRHFLIADDPQRFADAVIALLADPDKRKRLGNEARTLVAQQYSWQRAADLFDELYRQVAAGQLTR